MITWEMPENFKPKFDVVACYVEVGDHVLILRRHLAKSEGGKWGLPAGKVDDGESLQEAMVRELQEETGIVAEEAELEPPITSHVRYPDYDFTYVMFCLSRAERPEVCLNSMEHTAFDWVTPREALGWDLVLDQGDAFRMVYAI
jgi:8-oxo-dGTP diphosphatase